MSVTPGYRSSRAWRPLLNAFLNLLIFFRSLVRLPQAGETNERLQKPGSWKPTSKNSFFFFFDCMNSDGAVPAQSPRWKRGLVPVQFWSHLKPAADQSRGWSCSCGAFGGKLGIFSTHGFTQKKPDGAGPSSRAVFSHLAHVACVRLYTFSIGCPLG